MSVHVIYYKDGAKMMRPILTRQEYIALRDSEANRRAEKRAMVQFNYSCLPSLHPQTPPPIGGGGEYIPHEGPLKGATTPSGSVGMDIDFRVDDPDYEEKMRLVPEMILSKKEELGLLMLERSATKGYHIVFRRRPELSQEENLKWASELLGVEFDKGAKDITRVFFTPADKLLFLDDSIFEVKACAVNVQGAVKAHSAVNEPQTLLNSKASSPAPLTQRERLAFDLCVAEAGLNAEAMDIWGEHNWHSNLMAVLSVGLPKLMNKEQLYAVVREKLPNYSQTTDCRTLIEYFYENYTADKGFMSPKLRDINAQAQQMAANRSSLRPSDSDDAADAAELEALTRGWDPPKLPKKIPRLLELLVNNYDSRFREMLLMSSLPVLAAHASHFRAEYLSGKVLGCQTYVAIIGSSGKGKGNCTDLYNEMVKHTLKDSDDREWAKVDENEKLRDKMANAKDRPAKYHPKLRLFETTSKSSILDLQKNLGKNGMLLGQFSEVDGLSSSSRAAYSDISVILRKGWDGDTHRQYYMSESTCNTSAEMNLSLLMAGTVRAMLERMFSDKNCEGGLMQRCIPVVVPKTKRTFRPPKQNYLTDDEKKERDALLMELFQKDLSLGEDTLVLDLPLTNRAIGQWYDELEERYNDGMLTEAEADLSHRCGEFMLRAAIPLVALYGKETKEIVEFCRWVGESGHYTMCQLYGHRVQDDLTKADELLSDHNDGRKTVEPLLNRLPNVFNLQQIKDERIKAGQSPDVKGLLNRYCKNGKLVRVGRGIYRKAGVDILSES